MKTRDEALPLLRLPPGIKQGQNSFLRSIIAQQHLVKSLEDLRLPNFPS